MLLTLYMYQSSIHTTRCFVMYYVVYIYIKTNMIKLIEMSDMDLLTKEYVCNKYKKLKSLNKIIHSLFWTNNICSSNSVLLTIFLVKYQK